ncbi:DUF1543 domain-containing protein [Thorsellia kenyensis]|uniref:DUF1543 domain-containing protein n=1 Tax=Thorsellia kenyensis TaxID=1549888 RepID=A0ABV6CFR5_9GAMM
MQNLLTGLDSIPESGKPKLFLFYLGGRIQGGNIEVHDVQFVVGINPESCYSALKANWIGDKRHIHIDGYKELSYADGYDISLHEEKQNSDLKLFFINAGAYKKGELAELHQFDFFVDKDEKSAKARAMTKLLTGFHLQHKDDLADIDDCLLLTKIGRYYIHLTPSNTHQPNELLFQGYLPI